MLIDLSGSSLGITSDGKEYCYTINAVVNAKKFNRKKCNPLTSDTLMDRVLCLGAAVDQAYEFYKQGTGATQLTDSAKQDVYNEIVRQLMNDIKTLDLCNSAVISNGYQHAIQLMSAKVTTQAVNEINNHVKLLTTALMAQGCVGVYDDGKSSIKWYVWLIVALAILGIVLFIAWTRKDKILEKFKKSSTRAQK
jgi:hypothetical protein